MFAHYLKWAIKNNYLLWIEEVIVKTVKSEWLQKAGRFSFSMMMEIIYSLIVVVIPWIYTFIKIHLTIGMHLMLKNYVIFVEIIPEVVDLQMHILNFTFHFLLSFLNLRINCICFRNYRNFNKHIWLKSFTLWLLGPTTIILINISRKLGEFNKLVNIPEFMW